MAENAIIIVFVVMDIPGAYAGKCSGNVADRNEVTSQGAVVRIKSG